MGSVTIIGLGPAGGELITRQVWNLLSAAESVYLRTARHPAVAELPSTIQTHSFDGLYDEAEAFGDVYAEIVRRVVEMGKSADIIYAVPGHPHIAESTVIGIEKAAKAEGVSVRVLAAVSFVDVAMSAVSVDGLEGLQLFDAIEVAAFEHPPVNRERPLLLGQVYSRWLASELKLTLNRVYDEECVVQLIHGAGSEQELVEEMPLYQIDQSEHIDHLTSLFIPAQEHVGSLETLAETAAILRSPDGCPWDQEQTLQSMRSPLMGEVAEVLDALDNDDMPNLREELGDVIFNLVMLAQMAAEMDEFSITDVIGDIDAKIKYRHPHVWGDENVDDTDQVVLNWEALKAKEKEAKGEQKEGSLLASIPKSLSALTQAQKVQKKVKKVGFDWPTIAGVIDKVGEEIEEIKTADTPAEQASEIGDLLFAVVNWSRWLDIDAESALRESTKRFMNRFRIVEELARKQQVDLQSLDIIALDKLWEEAKAISRQEVL